ncbi:uncharacterized protein LOC141851025 [Brevipalpus obovatus]|uniref:uncharacterized protein LOC141851025 n=1 Tax=Brevipalpus obovatus TaxID=246614 RepID=UPI003D9EEC3F
MNFFGFRVVFSVLIVLIFHKIDIISACRCRYLDPREQFCRSSFAAIVLITKNRVVNTSPRERVYAVKVIQKFKSNSTDGHSTSLENGKLYSTSDSCGVLSLNLNTKYLITGGFVDGRARINLCDFIQELSSVTKQQLDGFGGKYNCN